MKVLFYQKERILHVGGFFCLKQTLFSIKRGRNVKSLLCNS